MDKAAKGEDDSEPWARLKERRKEIDNLAEEKLQIITKIYNLSQRFVQELNESIAETDKLIYEQKSSSSVRGQSYADVQAMVAVNTKSVYEMDDGLDSFSLERDIGMTKRKGQHRGADGKFESSMKDGDDFDMDLGGGGFGNHKQINKASKASKLQMGGSINMGRKGNDPLEFASMPKKRKGRGAGGHVANVFYDS